MSTPRQTHDDYRHFHAIIARWMDNDVYGHINNVVYYNYFGIVVDVYSIERGVLDPGHSNTVGLVIETQRNCLASLSFPDPVVAGLRAVRLGNTSVRYEVGLFRGDTQEATAQGHLVHVYVDRETRRPVTLPDALRAVFEPLASNITA